MNLSQICVLSNKSHGHNSQFLIRTIVICTFIFQHVSVHNSGEMINFLSYNSGAHSPLLHLNWKGSSVAMDLPDHLGQHNVRGLPWACLLWGILRQSISILSTKMKWNDAEGKFLKVQLGTDDDACLRNARELSVTWLNILNVLAAWGGNSFCSVEKQNIKKRQNNDKTWQSIN